MIMKIAIIIGYIIVGLLTFLGVYIVTGGDEEYDKADVIASDVLCLVIGLIWPLFLAFGILALILYGVYKILNLVLFQWLKKIGDKYRYSIFSKLYGNNYCNEEEYDECNEKDYDENEENEKDIE